MNLKEENEKLRDLLRRVYNYVPIPDQIRIDSALSHQGCNEVDPEPATSQDEREAFEHWHAAQEAGLAPEGVRAIHLVKEVYWQGWQARATLPAQKVNNVDTPEQQPVAWRWMYNGEPDGPYAFNYPLPDDDVVQRGLMAQRPRTVQPLYAAQGCPTNK